MNALKIKEKGGTGGRRKINEIKRKALEAAKRRAKTLR